MNLRDRIFELVFPDLKKKARGPGGEKEKPPRRKRRDRARKDDAGYDPRYFVRHQR